MKKFIVKTLIFKAIILLVFLWVCSKADGYTDPFYIRFTTPKQDCLIFGTSRAAQGLQPRIFDSILNKKFSNYSFTVLHSPYGKTYLNSIKKKINLNTRDGIFVVTVDPWSLASLTEKKDDSLLFRELDLSLANTQFVTLNPNPFYLVNNWNKKYFEILTKKKSKMFLHKDGWLEINIKFDSSAVKKKTLDLERTYRKNLLTKANFSKTRFEYLKKTIKFLKVRGKVFIVRLPVHPKMMQIENELMPNFNEEIMGAITITDGYLDLTNQNDNFNYNDGNHLHKESGALVSSVISNWIKNRM